MKPCAPNAMECDEPFDFLLPDAWASVSQFGAGDLTYQADDGPVTVPTGAKFLNQLALGEHCNSLLRAVMPGMTLTPGKALAQKTIGGKYEYTTIEYTIFLEHMPKLGGGSRFSCAGKGFLPSAFARSMKA